MSEQHQHSEVAWLREQIRMEYESAERGLYGLASGTARHNFINQKMERMGQWHEALQGLVGEYEAIKILTEVFEQPSSI